MKKVLSTTLFEYFTYDDVLIKPKFSRILSRKDVDISVKFFKDLILQVPLMSANMDSVFSESLATALYNAGGIATIPQFTSIEDQVNTYLKLVKKGIKVIPTTGVRSDFEERSAALVKAGTNIIMFDTPHAHSSYTIDAIKSFKKKYPKVFLIVGNIATKEACKDLINAGANAVKVGIGPGAGCLTRVKTGIGIPQLSAILEVSSVAKKYGVIVIADGGAKLPADLSKAIGAGADILMMGRVFASTNEADGQTKEINGKMYKVYMGSFSSEARKLRSEKDPTYKANKSQFVEGGKGYTEVTGSVEDIVNDYSGGLRSALSYVGAKNIKEFKEKVEFVKVTHSVIQENGLHDMIKID
ncbi:MAG: guanosine monophosphate reductase [bacterium]